MITRSLVILVAALPLAGCISFGAEPPPSLMTLTATNAVAVGEARSVREEDAITVMIPSVPQALLTPRVPVQTGPTAIAYLKDAQWVEAPNRLFRTLLAETIMARTGKMVPDARNFSISADSRLSGRLVNFGMDAPSRTAVVTYDATLVRKGATTVENRRFEAKADLASEEPATVAAALNQAANQVAAEVADWVK